MGEIVAGIGMSHAPPLTAESADPSSDRLERINRSLETLRKQLDAAEPELLIAVVDDHFENFFRQLMPTFAIGVAEQNYGPPDHYLEWLRLEQREIPNSVDYANDLLDDGVRQGFDLARVGRIAFGHALAVPMHFLRPEYDIPVVPVLTNVFTPPLAPPWRAFDLGQALRRTIERRPERVAILATGALSHWPPFWMPDSPKDDQFLQRMYRFQTEGLDVLKEDPNLFVDLGARENAMAASGARLVNPEWDQRIMQAFAEGDVEFVRSLTYEEIERDGGNGGHEVLNWIIMMGMCNGRPAEALTYDPATEWMCGIGFVSYSAERAGREPAPLATSA